MARQRGALLPAAAALAVPILAAVVLQLPAKAIERIAVPLFGAAASGGDGVVEQIAAPLHDRSPRVRSQPAPERAPSVHSESDSHPRTWRSRGSVAPSGDRRSVPSRPEGPGLPGDSDVPVATESPNGGSAGGGSASPGPAPPGPSDPRSGPGAGGDTAAGGGSSRAAGDGGGGGSEETQSGETSGPVDRGTSDDPLSDPAGSEGESSAEDLDVDFEPTVATTLSGGDEGAEKDDPGTRGSDGVDDSSLLAPPDQSAPPAGASGGENASGTDGGGVGGAVSDGGGEGSGEGGGEPAADGRTPSCSNSAPGRSGEAPPHASGSPGNSGAAPGRTRGCEDEGDAVPPGPGNLPGDGGNARGRSRGRRR